MLAIHSLVKGIKLLHSIRKFKATLMEKEREGKKGEVEVEIILAVYN